MTPEEQAARIAELETRVDLLQNELFEVRKGKDAQEVISELMARIAELEAQVAALQEIAIGGHADFLHYRASCYDPARRCPYAKGCDDCTSWDTCSALDRFNADAIRQLSEEHPEAFR